jgi:hypothetical protein
VIVGQTLSAGGAANVDSLLVANAANVGTTLSVGGALNAGDLTAGGAVIAGALVAGAFSTDALTVPKTVTVGETLSVGGALTAGNLSSATLEVPGVITAGSLQTSGSLQCGVDASARIELCSQSDGKNRGPSIDATTGGATKFHVGGVLKVKVSDEGVAIFGATSFSGDATFNGNATFSGETVVVNGQTTLVVDGNTTFNGALVVQGIDVVSQLAGLLAAVSTLTSEFNTTFSPS